MLECLHHHHYKSLSFHQSQDRQLYLQSIVFIGPSCSLDEIKKNIPSGFWQTQKRGLAHTVGNRKYRLCCFQVIGSLLPASAMPSNYFPISVPKSSSKEDLVYLYQMKICFSLMSPPTIVIAVLRGYQSKNQVKLFRYQYRPIGRMEFNL